MGKSLGGLNMFYFDFIGRYITQGSIVQQNVS